MAFSLEDKLSCSVCLNVSVEPVVLSCSHSFCTKCLPQRTCPLCRTTSSRPPTPNLTLKNICEVFLQTPDQEKQDIAQQKKDLSKNLLELRSRLKGLTQTERECERANGVLSEQVEAVETVIQEQFQRLHGVLQQEEESRLQTLKEEERQKRRQLKEKQEAVKEQRDTVEKTFNNAIRKLQENHKNQGSDSSVLHRFTALVKLTQRPLQEEELTLGSEALLDQAKHLGNLGFHIWTSLKSEAQFCPVVLDPNSASADVILSDNLRCLDVRAPSKRPLNAGRLGGSYWAVLGAQGLSSRVHSWEVDVSGSTEWALGVASRCERLPGVLSELWTLSLTQDGLEVGSLSGTRSVLSEAPQGLASVQLLLDLNHKELSFFSAETGSLLHSFTLPHTGGALFPYFYTSVNGSLKLRPQEVHMSAGTNQL